MRTKNRICCTTKKEFLDVFEELINYLVIYNEDVTWDDMIPDLVADDDKRQEAFELLLEWVDEEFGLIINK